MANANRHELTGMICLVVTALIWGSSFVSQVQGMDAVSPLFFNAFRFTLGALTVVPMLWVTSRRRARQAAKLAAEPGSASLSDTASSPAATPAWRRNPLIIGAICGLLLFGGATLQQYGIMYGRSAGRAGFLTALYIVMVPLLALVFLRRRVGLPVVLSVALAIAGFYFLCVTDGFGSLTMADWLLLASAVLFAAHILAIDTLGAAIDPILLSFLQFAFVAVFGWIGAVIDGSIDFAGAMAAWIPILYAGVGSVGIGFTLQVVGQQWVPPTRASLILSLESLFSALGGALILGEVMTGRGYLGCALIFAGTILAQIKPKLR